MKSEISLAAVIVLYKERLEDSITYKTLLKHANLPVFVYDNSPLSQIVKSDLQFTYVSNPINPGVSKAYNEAWKWAEKNNFTHLLVLDSDSSFPENSVSDYIVAATNYPESLIMPTMMSKERKISPFYFKFGKSHYGENISFGKIQLGKIVAINSGLLIPISVFRKIGGYNELLPLDWSDVCFMRKAAIKNIEAFHVPLQVQHGLSEHIKTSVESAMFRFALQLDGVRHVAFSWREKYQMYFWMAFKSLKLSLQHGSFWFLMRFFKTING